MLKRGHNSYVTLIEAERHINLRHAGTSAPRQAWDGLTHRRDKHRLLVNACDMIEQLPFPGRKSTTAQILVWPRDGSRDVPQTITHAQIELALWLAHQEAQPPEVAGESRAELIAQGVTSARIGKWAESYDSNKQQQGAMQSPTVALLLKPLLSGGFGIC
ncbi:MAG: hypothetical protein FWE40_05445 [Oscillospiraceae bacterium]|nr:hypothetical protein [Oscillospiraceae bacterium]